MSAAITAIAANSKSVRLGTLTLEVLVPEGLTLGSALKGMGGFIRRGVCLPEIRYILSELPEEQPGRVKLSLLPLGICPDWKEVERKYELSGLKPNPAAVVMANDCNWALPANVCVWRPEGGPLLYLAFYRDRSNHPYADIGVCKNSSMPAEMRRLICGAGILS